MVVTEAKVEQGAPARAVGDFGLLVIFQTDPSSEGAFLGSYFDC